MRLPGRAESNADKSNDHPGTKGERIYQSGVETIEGIEEYLIATNLDEAEYRHDDEAEDHYDRPNRVVVGDRKISAKSHIYQN